MRERPTESLHERMQSLLSDYLEESLPNDVRQELESHLRECDDCDRLAEGLRATLRDLRAFPRLEVPPNFMARVLEKTLRGNRAPAPWEALVSWLGLPRLSPAAAAALLVLPFVFMAGTRDGQQMTREASMAVHQTYSNAVRLYYRRGDLRETAVAVGRKVPGQLEETVDWIRKRIETGEQEKNPPQKPGNPGQQSVRSAQRDSTA
jgi:anti-sigma factor RsiW